MIIRPERPEDIGEIHALTAAAFDGRPYSDGSEPVIVDKLRKAGALSISLVAVGDNGLAGHIAFSPVTLSDGTENWFGLGPLSVLPELQRQGIGSSLVQAGIAELKAKDAGGCILVGDPGYYQRFGFQHDARVTLPDFAPQYFLVLPLSPVPASGMVAFHPAFTPDTTG